VTRARQAPTGAMVSAARGLSWSARPRAPWRLSDHGSGVRHSGARRPLGRARGQGGLAACAGDATAAASTGAESNGTRCCSDGNPVASRARAAEEFLGEKTLTG
jgi:hypothetical protein